MKSWVKELLLCFICSICLNILLNLPFGIIPIGVMLVNIWLLFSVNAVLLFVSSKIRYTIYTLQVVLFGILTFGNYIKVDQRAEPILPSDAGLVGEAWTLLPNYITVLNLSILLVSAGIITTVFYFVITRWSKLSRAFSIRETYGGPIVVLVISLILSQVPQETFAQLTGTKRNEDNLLLHAQSNGYLLSSLYQMTRSIEAKEEAQTEVAPPVQQLETEVSAPSERPNVIAIQLEAVVDSAFLSEFLTFSESPTPFMTKQFQERVHGKLVTPIFAGGTVNSEYEFLTSDSMHFFGPGEIAYHSIKTKTQALPKMFNALGYQTTAIHNHTEELYNRREVFKQMEFNTFISRQSFEEDMENYFLPDSYLFERVLQTMKETDERDFILGVGVETHGPYDQLDHPSHGITVEDTEGVLDEHERQIVENYVNELHSLDKALQSFIEAVSKWDEPTIVVVYSDHLPALGKGTGIYEKLGIYLDTTDIDGYLTKFKTPFFIYDNYRTDVMNETQELSPNFLAPYVLEYYDFVGFPVHQLLRRYMHEGVMVSPFPQYEADFGWTPERKNEYRAMRSTIQINE
ncbi:MAG: LTA synthase family protein [Bacilli bacterium]